MDNSPLSDEAIKRGCTNGSPTGRAREHYLLIPKPSLADQSHIQHPVNAFGSRPVSGDQQRRDLDRNRRLSRRQDLVSRQLGEFQDRLLANLRGSVTIQHSPDGQWIAKATAAPAIELISSDTGRVVARKEISQDIKSLAWSKNSNRIAISLLSGELQLLDTPSQGTTELVLTHVQDLLNPYSEIIWIEEQHAYWSHQ